MRSLLGTLLLVAACGGSSSGQPGDDVVGGDDVQGQDAGDDGGGPGIDAGDGSDAGPGSDAGEVVISNCAAGTWCTEAAPAGVTAELRGVYAADANHVFAVGKGGVILLRTDAAWTSMTSGTTKDLNGVWAASATDAWAVGAGGTVLHWNGTSWSASAGVVASTTNTAIWGSSTTDVWVSCTAQMQHWNGTTWSTGNLSATPNDLDGSSSTDVWSGGDNTGVLHYAAGWTGSSPAATAPSGVGANVYSIEAMAANDVWACGAGCAHWNGTAWTTANTNLISFAQMYGTATDRVFGVSQNDIGFWNGTSWSVTTPTGLTASLRSVTGAGPHTWTVGTGAAILYHHD
ncbi:MAG TPA: hypothetical protein VGM90_19140 [Kofleriaceae bacterium]|jgi:hypothetical protein